MSQFPFSQRHFLEYLDLGNHFKKGKWEVCFLFVYLFKAPYVLTVGALHPWMAYIHIYTCESWAWHPISHERIHRLLRLTTIPAVNTPTLGLTYHPFSTTPHLINDKLFQASPSVQLSPLIVYFNKFVLIANNNILQDLRESLALTCVQIHMSMEDLSTRYFEDTGRHYFITRSSFLKLLGTFAHIVRSREDTMQTKR